jgi:4a-hydroxytetrahydrobiopterin dehydratase
MQPQLPVPLQSQLQPLASSAYEIGESAKVAGNVRSSGASLTLSGQQLQQQLQQQQQQAPPLQQLMSTMVEQQQQIQLLQQQQQLQLQQLQQQQQQQQQQSPPQASVRQLMTTAVEKQQPQQLKQTLGQLQQPQIQVQMLPKVVEPSQQDLAAIQSQHQQQQQQQQLIVHEHLQQCQQGLQAFQAVLPQQVQQQIPQQQSASQQQQPQPQQLLQVQPLSTMVERWTYESVGGIASGLLPAAAGTKSVVPHEDGASSPSLMVTQVSMSALSDQSSASESKDSDEGTDLPEGVELLEDGKVVCTMCGHQFRSAQISKANMRTHETKNHKHLEWLESQPDRKESSNAVCPLGSRKRCRPCKGDTISLLADSEVALKMTRLMLGWTVVEGGKKLQRSFTAKNFKAAMMYLNKAAEIAEAQQHHPDLHLVKYREVVVEIWTHSLNGITENDFILAELLDSIAQ